VPNVIELESQGEQVQEFFDSLPHSPGETLIKRKGRRPIIVVTPESEAQNSEWTSEKNERRFGLIQKKIAGNATPLELGELACLQEEVDAWIDKVAPRPLEEAEQILASLIDRILKKQSGSEQ